MFWPILQKPKTKKDHQGPLSVVFAQRYEAEPPSAGLADS